ncbi:alpha/beta hydrolase fold protein [Tanacetum coccineum]
MLSVTYPYTISVMKMKNDSYFYTRFVENSLCVKNLQYDDVAIWSNMLYLIYFNVRINWLCLGTGHQSVHMSRSEHAVVDDAGEDDGTEKKKKYFKRLPKMILNGYVRRDTYRMKKDNGEKIYRKLDSCLVIPLPKGKKAKAIIKFLGGAFIGAVPEVTYGSVVLPVFIRYLIISVPYNVTFDHSQAAREVFERFYSCLNSVLTYGLPSDGLLAAELVDLPLYSVGHSNGALLQVLGGSYFSDKLPKLGPLVSQMMPMVEASHVSSMAKSVADAWKTLLDTAEAMTPDYDPETRVSLDKFFDQLPSVFNQVAQGISEFKPTPTENRECCKNSYNVPKTLLVKFNTDAIDETDLLEETLRPRVEAIGGTLDIVSLSGNHITPCIQVFFPMLDTDLRHYFIVYMNLKYNRIEYLDNIFSIETDPNARYGFPSMTLVSLFEDYMLHVDHPSYRQMSASAEKRILTLGCRTTNNSIDCGVFVMRHMETYRGEGDRGDRCCLKKEGPEQHKQINDLRYKYATKILLADCNKAKSMVEQETHAFKILPVEEK